MEKDCSRIWSRIGVGFALIRSRIGEIFCCRSATFYWKIPNVFEDFCASIDPKRSADIVPGNPPFRPDFGQIKGVPGGGSSQDDNLDTPTGNPPPSSPKMSSPRTVSVAFSPCKSRFEGSKIAKIFSPAAGQISTSLIKSWISGDPSSSNQGRGVPWHYIR